MRAHPEIEQHRRDPAGPGEFVGNRRRERFVEGVEPGVAHPGAVAKGREASGRRGDRLGVAVDPDQDQVRTALEDCCGVPAAAERRVDDDARRHGSDERDDLVDHDRRVERPLAHPQPPDPRPGESRPAERMEIGGEGMMLAILGRGRGAADGPGDVSSWVTLVLRARPSPWAGLQAHTVGHRHDHAPVAAPAPVGTRALASQFDGDHSSTWSMTPTTTTSRSSPA